MSCHKRHDINIGKSRILRIGLTPFSLHWPERQRILLCQDSLHHMILWIGVSEKERNKDVLIDV